MITAFFKFLVSARLWLNVLLIGLLSVALFLMTVLFLGSYTKHGESITVPSFEGMTLGQVQEVIKEKPLEYLVADTVYVKGNLPLAIIKQNPAAGEKVKEDRRIYLTINAPEAPLTKVPELNDVSLKQARLILNSIGLEEGKLTYVSCVGKNVVKQATVNGKDLQKGMKIQKGTFVDLVLCEGKGSGSMEVMDLTGMRYDEAVQLIRLSDLTLGIVDTDDGLTDPSSGIVIDQLPIADGINMIRIGEPIDLTFGKKIRVREDLGEDFEDDFEIKSAGTPVEEEKEKIVPINFSDPEEMEKLRKMLLEKKKAAEADDSELEEDVDDAVQEVEGEKSEQESENENETEEGRPNKVDDDSPTVFDDPIESNKPADDKSEESDENADQIDEDNE